MKSIHKNKQMIVQLSDIERLVLDYGMSYHKGNSRPHFIVSGVHQKLVGRSYWRTGSAGQVQDKALAQFPELEQLFRWHLCDDNGVPMHYLANAKYWAEYFLGCSKWEQTSYDPVETWKSTVIYGAVPDIDPEDYKDIVVCHLIDGGPCTAQDMVEDYQLWAQLRLPLLQEQFHADMAAFDIEYITPEECS